MPAEKQHTPEADARSDLGGVALTAVPVKENDMVDRTRRVVRVVGLTAMAVPVTVWWLTPPDDEFTRAMAAVIIWASGVVYGALLASRGGRS